MVFDGFALQGRWGHCLIDDVWGASTLIVGQLALGVERWRHALHMNVVLWVASRLTRGME